MHRKWSLTISKAATIDNQPPRFYRVAAFCNAAHSVEANRSKRAVSRISDADVVQRTNRSASLPGV
jgi:hypothetical protein